MIGKQLRVFIVQQYQVTNKNNLIRCGLKENYSLAFNFFCYTWFHHMQCQSIRINLNASIQVLELFQLSKINFLPCSEDVLANLEIQTTKQQVS